MQDEDDEENEEEEGGLSKSGKELKKLLGKANGLNESDEDDDDDSDDVSPLQFSTYFTSKQKKFNFQAQSYELVWIHANHSECHFLGGGDKLWSSYEF